MSSLTKARLLGGSGVVLLGIQMIFMNQYASFLNAHLATYYVPPGRLAGWSMLVVIGTVLVAALMLNAGFIYWQFDRAQKRNARDPHIMRNYGLPKDIKSRLRTIAKMATFAIRHSRVRQLCDDTTVFFQGEYSLDQLREFTEQLDYLIESMTNHAEISDNPQRFGDAEELRETLDLAIDGYAATIAGALQRRNTSRSDQIRDVAEKLIARGKAEGDVPNTTETPNL